MTASALTLPTELDEVLEALAGIRVIVAIDNAEELLDPGNRLRDPELDSVVKALLLRRDHGVKLILVTREAPDSLLREFPGGTARLDLGRGLPATDAHDFLRALDSSGILGLRSAPVGQLERARELTGGHPRALEALGSILDSDPDIALPELLGELELLPADQDMLSYLIGRMFDRLGPVDRRVMQALAIYGSPVLPAAVDYLLQPYLEGFDSGPALKRLTARRLIRQDGDRLYLPTSPDGVLVLGAVPAGQPADRDRDPPPLTRLALLHRAAGYFVGARKGRAEHLDDLSVNAGQLGTVVK